MPKNLPPEYEIERLMKTRRLSRREALMQLSALAVGSTAFAAACSSDSDAMHAATGGGGTGATAGASGSVAGSPGAAGATPSMPASASAGMSGAAGRTSGAAGATSGPAGSNAAGAPAMTAAGSPAAGSGGTGAAGSTAAGSGGTGAAGTGGATTIDMLQCVVTPAMTDGPFFVDQQMQRSNLVMGETSDAITKAVPLRLQIGVFTASGMMCKPISGVHVDIWHADALGVYSDVAPGAVQSVDTRGKQFLRGWQATDESGLVTFDTIWPGWYMSRTIHIHFKLRMLAGARQMTFTSQMFFDEAINAMVLSKAPYSTHPGMRSVLNDGDHIYNGTATNSQKPPAGQTAPGKLIMPTIAPMGAGFAGVLKIGVQG